VQVWLGSFHFALIMPESSGKTNSGWLFHDCKIGDQFDNLYAVASQREDVKT